MFTSEAFHRADNQTVSETTGLSYCSDKNPIINPIEHILINVLGTVDMLYKFSVACSMYIAGIEMKWSTFYVPPCSTV